MAKKNENPNAFKLWINEAVIDDYAQGLKTVFPSFSAKEFLKIKSKLGPLELRDRVRLISDALHRNLPADYPIALSILLKAVKKEKLDGFSLWPTTEFIQIYGLEFFDESFSAMQDLTEKFTAEFAVRPFIVRYPNESHRFLNRVATSKNEHHRRWASEGSRPRLPWGQRLHELVKNPKPNLEILEKLKFDPELYVRKSVSNHLNDISKDHPALVVQTLKRWKKTIPVGFEKEFEFIARQSLRTLIIKGDAEALRFFGVVPGDSTLSVGRFKIQPKVVSQGGALAFEFELSNTSKSSVREFVLDYVIHHRKANGSLTGKVFKLKKGKISAAQKMCFQKRHSFKAVTTRTYYPGTHEIEIMLNGKAAAKARFELS